MSKSTWQSKERFEALIMEFINPVKIDSISIDENGYVKFFCNGSEMVPDTIHFEKGYERDKKPKVTVYYEADKANTNMDSILLDFDYLIAVDTNDTRYEHFSVGMIYKLSKYESDKSQVCVEYILSLFRLFNNQEVMDGESAELVALDKMICFLQSGNIIPDFSSKKILCVIDHHFDLINQFNDRITPLLKNNSESFLGRNIRLIYAGSDTKNDSIFNRILRDCDKEANRFKDVKEREKSGLLSGLILSMNDYVTQNLGYILADYGTVFTSDYFSDIEVLYRNKQKNLNIKIHFMFKSDDGEMRTNARISDFNAHLLCTNYNGMFGAGIITPLEIGEKNRKKFYFLYWISDADEGQTARKIDYSIFSDK